MAGDQGPLSIAIAVTEPSGITFTGPPFLPSRIWPVKSCAAPVRVVVDQAMSGRSNIALARIAPAMPPTACATI
jgi:hypothetical protein